MVAVVAHGFSASKEIMTSFGVALAGQGITTYCLDLPGHGDSPVPLPDLARQSGLDQLTTAVSEVVNLALRQHPGASLVLIGHSMGTSAIGDYALTHPRLHALAATVLVSPVLTHMPTPDNPPNLLILTGENDIPALLPLSRKLIASGCGVPLDRVSGDVYTCQGAGPRYERRVAFLPGLNHISILTASSTQVALLAWLHETANPAISSAYVIADEQLHWMLLGMLAAALAVFPLMSLGGIALRLTGLEGEMPGISDRARVNWPRSLGVTAGALAVACTVGLIGLMWVPLEIVRQRFSNNIGGYFLIAGLALAMLLALVPGLRRKLPVPAARSVPGQMLLAVIVVAFLYLTLGKLSTYLWASMALPPQRRCCHSSLERSCSYPDSGPASLSPLLATR
jgi:pimeloyl-ACP methyl ester carboxylesterase